MTYDNGILRTKKRWHSERKGREENIGQRLKKNSSFFLPNSVWIDVPVTIYCSQKTMPRDFDDDVAVIMSVVVAGTLYEDR